MTKPTMTLEEIKEVLSMVAEIMVNRDIAVSRCECGPSPDLTPPLHAKRCNYCLGISARQHVSVSDYHRRAVIEFTRRLGVRDDWQPTEFELPANVAKMIEDLHDDSPTDV